MRVAVVGAGSWGTALGHTLATKDYDVRIWDIDPEPLRTIGQSHENTRYLPGLPLAPSLRPEPDLGAAIAGADLVVLAVPSHAMRPVAVQVADHLRVGMAICSVTKGIETDTLMTMSEVLEDVLPGKLHPFLTFLSGPSFAVEVAAGHPTAVTIAGPVHEVASRVQEAFHTPFMRPYTSTDVVGVEIGGCAKNVIAIATGLSAGLGYDANARAALITRGLAEITRLAVARGANPLTLSGLAGVGDLVLTCSSKKSRNYRVGFGLGQGRALADIQAELGQVAEGVLNARSVHDLAQQAGVEMPITAAVYAMIYQDLPAREVAARLMGRDLKPEADSHP